MAVIRRFSAEDSGQLHAIIDTVCGEGRWMSTSCFQPTSEWTHALTWTACDRHLLLVVEIDRALVGWCRLFPASSCTAEPLNHDLGIGVLEDYRDQGLGTFLVGTALRWARSNSARQVMLDTRPDNQRAIHVFEKSGFQVCGQPANDLLHMKCAW